MSHAISLSPHWERNYDHHHQRFTRAANDIIAGAVPTTLHMDGLRLEDIIVVEKSLERFILEATSEERAAWTIDVVRDPAEPDPDDGIITREHAEGKDWKTFLHYRPDLPDLLCRAGVRFYDYQDEMLHAADNIWQVCVNHYYELAAAFDAQFPGINLYKRAIAAADQHVLRMNSYELRAVPIIAVPHCDRNALTFSLYESSPGLYGYRNGVRVECESSPGITAALFSGKQLENLTRGAIPAFKHGVENTDPDTQRYSMAWFAKAYGLGGVGT